MNDDNPANQLKHTPIEVFIAYSHQDAGLKDELYSHLAALIQKSKIQPWQDRDIDTGNEWTEDIKAHVESASIILLLLTPRFITSPSCFCKEMQRAMERHREKTATVIPIIMKPCMWNQTKFSKLQVFPTEATPVTLWENPDAALQDVVNGIERVVDTLLQRQSITKDNGV